MPVKIPPPPGAPGSGTTTKGGPSRPTTKIPGPPRAATKGSYKRARKEKKDEGGGGGIGGLFSEGFGIVKSVPSGLVHLGVSGVKEVGSAAINSPKNLYEGVTEGDIDKIAKGFPVTSVPYTLGSGFVEGTGIGQNTPEGAENTDNPFSSAFGASFRRTYEDVRDPERFVDAYEEGRLVGKVLEDVGNVALVGGVAAKTLNAGSKGAFAGAAQARSTATAAEAALQTGRKTVANLEKQAATHAEQVTRIEAAIAEGGRKTAARLKTSWDDAKQVADNSAAKLTEAQEGLAGMEAVAVNATEVAAAKLAGMGPGFRAYRTAKAVELLGGQGASLPMKPVEWAMKGMSKGSRAFFSNPAVKQSLNDFDERVGVMEAVQSGRLARATTTVARGARGVVRAGQRHAERKELSAKVAQKEAEAAAKAQRVGRAIDGINQLAEGDQAVFQAAMLVATGGGKAIHDMIDLVDQPGVRNAALDEGLAARLDELAEVLHYEPEALRMAVDYARRPTRYDPARRMDVPDPRALPDAVRAQIDAINELWDRQVSPELLADITTDTMGSQRGVQTEAQRELAEWNISGEDIPPAVRRRLEQKILSETLARQGKVVRGVERATEQAERLGVTPGARGTEAANQAAAAAVEGATGRGSIGALRQFQRAAEAQGRATTARSAAERFQVLREAIPESVPDEAIAALVESVDDLRAARDLLEESRSDLVLGETPLREQERAIADEIRGARRQVREVVDNEIGVAEAGLPIEPIPWVPADLDEAHGILHEAAGAREASVFVQMDKIKSRRGGRNKSDVQLFIEAYKNIRNKQSNAVKRAFPALDDAELGALWERRAGGRSTGYGFDDTVAQYVETVRGRGAGGDPNLDLADFAEGYARRANLQEIQANLKGNAWNPDLIDRIRGNMHDEAAVALFDDPVMAAAMEGNIPAAVQRLIDERGAAPSLRDSLPPADDVVAGMERAGWPVDDLAVERVIRDVWPDQASAENFLDAWARADPGPLWESLDELANGTTPAWMTAAEAGEMPPTMLEGLAANRAVGEAEAAVAGVVGEAGGQPVRGLAARERGLLSARAAQAERGAAKLPEAEQAAVAGLTGQGAKKGVKAGKQLERYEKTIGKVHKSIDQLEALPDEILAELEAIYADIENAPARARTSIVMARDFTESLVKWRDQIVKAKAGGEGAPELGGQLDPAVLPAIDRMIAASIKDIRDIWGGKVQAGGEVVAAPPPFEPQYRPGGQPLRLREEGRRSGQRATSEQEYRQKKSTPERMRETSQLPRDVKELKYAMGQRIRSQTTNEVSHMIETTYGTRAFQVLDDIEPEVLAKMKGPALEAEMKARGWVAWDPKSMTGRVPDARLTEHALWLPETIAKSIQDYYGKGGKLEQFMRSYYDKPITFWKAAVLALRPAWHVNNMLSNATMAMVGGGFGPIEYVRQLRNARALLGLPEALDAAAIPGSAVRAGPFAGRRAARVGSERRIARMQRRVERLPEQTRAAIGATEDPMAAALPPRLVEGPAGAAMTQPGELAGILDNPGRLRRFVTKSYALNGAVDDMSRVAVFLNRAKKLSDSDLLNMQAKSPELHGLTLDQLRREGAVRISLSVAGDFLRMTPIERQVFRRVLPFYVWMRHITQLSAKLPIFHPARTVWTLHLAEMWGAPGDYGLINAVPTGPGNVAQLPVLSPFGDAPETADPSQLGFSLSPFIKIPVGATTGMDVNRWTQFQRPPGQPGGYGGDPAGAPLIDIFGGTGIHFNELGNYLGAQVPQTRVVRGALGEAGLPGGQDVGKMRYTLGQLRRQPITQGGEPLQSGEPAYGPLARVLGLPYFRAPSKYEKPDVKQMLKELERTTPR